MPLNSTDLFILLQRNSVITSENLPTAARVCSGYFIKLLQALGRGNPGCSILYGEKEESLVVCKVQESVAQVALLGSIFTAII